jgi:tetratricopeptide (TPR) repeat protein
MASLLSRSSTIFLTLVTLSIPIFAQVRPAPASVEINGQVRFANGGGPAEKVLVLLEFFNGGTVDQILTDRTGKFRFSRLTPAQYILTVRSQGYKEIRQQIDLQTTYRDYLQIQLAPEKTEVVQPSEPSILINASIPPEAQKEFDQGRKMILEEKKVEGGISHLEKAVSLHPNFLDAHMLLGTAYLDTRQFDKAEREMRRVLEIKSSTPAAYFTLGEVYRRQQKYNEAEKVLQEGLKLEPKSHQGHFTLGQVYFAKGDLAKAGPEIGQTIQLKPDFAEAYVIAGNLFMKARQAQNALGMYQEYLRLDPSGQYAAETREYVEKIKKALGEKK